MCNRLFAVGETIGITIGIVRVRAVGQFLAVGYTVAPSLSAFAGLVPARPSSASVSPSLSVSLVVSAKIPSSERPRPSGSRRRPEDPYVQSTLRRR